MEKDGHGHSYLLVYGLGEKIRQFRQIGLKTPDPEDEFFKEFNQELCLRIKGAIPQVKVVSIKMRDLADDIMSKALEKKNFLKNAIVVSTCMEVVIPTKGHIIEINRIVNSSGEIIGLGPRPGYPVIDDQIRSINANNEEPLILVEDGSFSGVTVCYILKKLEQRGLPVAAAILGFVFPKAREVIKKEFKGDVITIEKETHLYDWMPDYDFFPFAPNCGRVLGVSVGGHIYPFYTHDGASYSIPYIYPFGPMTEWASIPKEHANSLSLYCVEQALTLFKHLEQINKKDIRIGDIVNSRTRSRVSIPISINQKSLPRLDTRIIYFLQDTCHELA